MTDEIKAILDKKAEDVTEAPELTLNVEVRAVLVDVFLNNWSVIVPAAITGETRF